MKLTWHITFSLISSHTFVTLVFHLSLFFIRVNKTFSKYFTNMFHRSRVPFYRHHLLFRNVFRKNFRIFIFLLLTSIIKIALTKTQKPEEPEILFLSTKTHLVVIILLTPANLFFFALESAVFEFFMLKKKKNHETFPWLLSRLAVTIISKLICRVIAVADVVTVNYITVFQRSFMLVSYESPSQQWCFTLTRIRVHRRCQFVSILSSFSESLGARAWWNIES